VQERAVEPGHGAQVAGDAPVHAPIQGISDDRMPDRAQMDADLMGPSCLDRDSRERQGAAQVLGADDPRDRFAAAPRARRHFLAVHRVAANRRVDPPSGLHFAPDERVVLLLDFAVAKLAGEGRLTAVERVQAAEPRGPRRRILVVDDSLTVRELERKLLTHHGYEVEIALDGMDGWNAVRSAPFDLVITDVDMPRMDGIELVSRITRDPQLKSTPVMIVSYKDREDDRRRGLDAGAAYYLAKGSFHDETLVQAVVDLIGGAQS